MTTAQKIVALGALSGVATMIVSMIVLSQLPFVSPDMTDASRRLIYTLQADAFAVLPLFASIAAVGNSRSKSEAIDPTAGKESAGMIIDGRVVDNTMQQFVLFFVATTALSINLTATEMRYIPAAVIVFTVARIAFWIGYRINPLYRAFGMAATSFLNMGLWGFAMWRIVMPGAA